MPPHQLDLTIGPVHLLFTIEVEILAVDLFQMGGELLLFDGEFFQVDITALKRENGYKRFIVQQ